MSGGQSDGMHEQGKADLVQIGGGGDALKRRGAAAA
jgi:hypothetical protein